MVVGLFSSTTTTENPELAKVIVHLLGTSPFPLICNGVAS